MIIIIIIIKIPKKSLFANKAAILNSQIVLLNVSKIFYE